MFDIKTSELKMYIDEYIFDERARKMLKRRLIDGITYDTIAEEFDISSRQAKNIIYKYKNKLFQKISKLLDK